VATLAQKAKPFLEKENIEIKSDVWLELLISVLQDRMTHIGEIVDLHKAFFHQAFKLSDEGLLFLQENQSLHLISAFYENLKSSSFTPEDIEALIKQTGKSLEIKGKPLFMGLRISTTGDMHGPSLPISLALLGKNNVLNRLEQTMNQLRGELK